MSNFRETQDRPPRTSAPLPDLACLYPSKAGTDATLPVQLTQEQDYTTPQMKG